MNKDVNKETKYYDATNVMFVEQWAAAKNPNRKYAAIQYRKKDDGYFECVISIPLPKVELHNFGKDLAKLVFDSSNDIVETIEDYTSKHPEQRIENKYKNKHLVIVPDEDGNDFTISMDENYANKIFEENDELFKEIKEELKSIVEKVKQLKGSSKLFYVHILDKRRFGNSEDNKMLMENVKKWITRRHDYPCSSRSIIIADDSIIAFGFPSVVEDE